MNDSMNWGGSSSVYDVFNGDADGICALQQLRLAFPCEAALVTGVKRDVSLLQRVPPGSGTVVTVLDVSLDANVNEVHHILEAGGQVTYFDHHSARQAFRHPRLRMFWDDAPDTCTSILVDRHLQGRFRKWAVTAAFGDNLPASARALAATTGMSSHAIEPLEKLGQLLNYNAYGERIEDLHVAPDTLYRALQPYEDPLEFIFASPYFSILNEGYRDDMARLGACKADYCFEEGEIYILPCAPWARRVSGMFANRLVQNGTGRSFAVLTEGSDGSFVVSVRSGQPERRSAEGLCKRFPTGGGRLAAAGINALPASTLDGFVRAFADYFCADAAVDGG